MPITVCPSNRKRRATQPPMKPELPVIITFIKLPQDYGIHAFGVIDL